jgi:hypothetical protein
MVCIKYSNCQQKKFDLQLRKYKHNLIGFESRDNKLKKISFINVFDMADSNTSIFSHSHDWM